MSLALCIVSVPDWVCHSANGAKQSHVGPNTPAPTVVANLILRNALSNSCNTCCAYIGSQGRRCYCTPWGENGMYGHQTERFTCIGE